MEIKVLKNILSANDEIAQRNHDLLNEHDVFAVNIMASPGAGKTSLIIETIRRLKDRLRIAVIEGDIASSVDAETVSKEGIPVVQINTGGSCHLDANMIQNALRNMALDDIDLIIIENVGNLVCPAEFTIGDHKKVLISSSPEGHDKPFKYPLMFDTVDLVLLNKVDLIPYLNFNLEAFSKAVKGIKENLDVFPISCNNGEGIDKWISWLLDQTTKYLRN
jgi:hydrogenase nickel incorporation protein HypB